MIIIQPKYQNIYLTYGEENFSTINTTLEGKTVYYPGLGIIFDRTHRSICILDTYLVSRRSKSSLSDRNYKGHMGGIVIFVIAICWPRFSGLESSDLQ